MSKVAVIYKSHYGHTKEYATLLAQQLNADLLENKKLSFEQIKDYDIILYGGGVYAGGINGISLIADCISKLQDKTLILFTCGLSDPDSAQNQANRDAGIAKAFGGSIPSNLSVFHLQSGIDYTRLNLLHKIMMKGLKSVLSKKPRAELRAEDIQILDSYGQVIHHFYPESTLPIIELITKLQA